MMPSATVDEALRALVSDALRKELPAQLREVLPALLREVLLALSKEHRVEHVGGVARVSAIEGDLLTVKQVAAFLDVSEPTVRRWINKGDLPANHVGPRHLLRVRRADLEKFLRSDRQQAPGVQAADVDAEAAKIVAYTRSRPRKNERAPRTRPAAPHQTGE